MNTIEKAEELKAQIEDVDIEVKGFSLADAIREGSSNSEQAYGWGEGDTMCTMHAAVSSAIARNQL